MTIGVVIWSCVAIFGAVALIAFQLVVVRLVGAARRRRQRRLERQWLPLLVQGLDEVPDSLPSIARRDMASFLSLWNRVYDSIRGGFNASLCRMALLAGADAAARRMFFSTTARDRLLAIATLGRLRDRSMWHELEQLASSRDLMLSLTAARAMVRIDPRKATTLLLPIIAEREDWPAGTVVLMLQDVGADVLSAPLVETITRTAPERAQRLIRYLGLAHAEAAVPLLRLLIRQVDHLESITACLRVFTDGSDLGAVRPYLYHPQWEVRVRAVDVLGRLGTARDEGRLTAMLSDAEWWVRYRAAQALCALSSDLERVKRVRATHGDPFARDILAHVLAEREAA